MIQFDIPSYVLSAIARLENSGYETYMVGGCVRDMLLGNTPNDYDLTTAATPDTVCSVFSDCKLILTGIKHGTVTVIYEGNMLEVTTFRRDGEYIDYRHPQEVHFSYSVKEDALRRDFTINAMFYNPSRKLVDFFDGAKDLKNKVIRCVGAPEMRFKEDALRVLRALRFAATLNFEIEQETLKAIYSTAYLLNNIAYERIFSELCDFFASKQSAKLCCENIKLFSDILGVTSTEDETFLVLEDQSETFRLASFFALYGGKYGAVPLVKKLKPDRKTVVLVSAAVEAAYGKELYTKKGIVDIVLKYGVSIYADMINLAKSMNNPICSDATEILSGILKGDLPQSYRQLNVNGKDLIDFNIANGKNIGAILHELLVKVYCGLSNEKEALLTVAKTMN